FSQVTTNDLLPVALLIALIIILIAVGIGALLYRLVLVPHIHGLHASVGYLSQQCTALQSRLAAFESKVDLILSNAIPRNLDRPSDETPPGERKGEDAPTESGRGQWQ